MGNSLASTGRNRKPVKAIKEWWVSLSGEPQDLDDLVEAFRTSKVCQVEQDEDGKCYMKAKSLDGFSDAWMVMAKAVHLVNRINGVMKAIFRDFRPIQANAPCGIYEDGTRNYCVLPESAQLEIRGSRPIVSVSGDGSSKPLRSEAEAWLAMSDNDADVRDALLFLSRPPNWFDLYKTYEVVCNAMGGRDVAERELSTDAADRASWRKKLKLLTQTANTVWDIRHARPSGNPPEHPMTLQEAHRAIRELVARFLRHRMSHR